MKYLVAIKEKKTSLPEPPMSYRLFQWREHMHVSYEDMLKTPASVIMDDINMINLENQFKPTE